MAQAETVGKVPWWRGARGEWYVVIQIALFILVAFGPRGCAGLPIWPAALAPLATGLGILLMGAGCVLLFAALVRLGKNLTPLPYPKDNGALVQTGAYRLVRHPIYCGGLALAFGWAFYVQGLLTVVYAVLLFALFDLKSRREECWLSAKYPGYSEYQQRVRRLIPFLY
jgi:protein-S-isoprenylcysteine O-methyltransferase Ste14